MYLVTIQFETKEQAEEWMSWHDNAGEQDYFTTGEIRGETEHYVNVFNYDYTKRHIMATKVDETED